MSIQPELSVVLAVAFSVTCVVTLIAIVKRDRAVFAWGLLGVVLSHCVPMPPEDGKRESEWRTLEDKHLARLKRFAQHQLISTSVGAAGGVAIGVALYALVVRKSSAERDRSDEEL